MSSELNQGLLDFLKASPTPYHATQNIAQKLATAGFQTLNEENAWNLGQGCYFVTRGASIIALNINPKTLTDTGLKMVGAHTDSPCLKVKPNPLIEESSYQQVGVEVYGGVLLNPWFDRDLSLAGKVTYLNQAGELRSTLVNLESAVAIIPSLAIHLDREANTKRSINAQTDLPPIVGQSFGDFDALLKRGIGQQHPNALADQILAFDLSFYDVNPPACIGINQEFIASARLDNLLSCYLAVEALMAASAENTLVVLNDHEEVGSASAAGADGSFLTDVLERLFDRSETRIRTLASSMLISTDNAHGVHPNFTSKHDPLHGPLLNQGPVIKVNSNQRYATDGDTHGFFKALCQTQNIPHQVFVTRSDMGCGSTIGPITASKLGVKTLDVGLPTFGMHSIREVAGAADSAYLKKALTAFFKFDGGIQVQIEH